MIALRPYQEEALGVIMADLAREPYVLLQAATGAGKTIIFAELIRRWMTAYPAMTAIIVAHRQELITQAQAKLLAVWPEGWTRIGLACAGVGPVKINRPLTIGSVQTLDRRALTRPIDLLIIDEAHHVPALETGGRYHNLISQLLITNPGLRVLGVTATPYRLGHGHIYGQDCRPDRSNFWPRLNHAIDMRSLIDTEFLAPWRAKEGASLGRDLAQVKIKNGEYDAADLARLLLRGVHINSAVAAYEKYGESRGKALIFAVSIEHAERLAGAFNRAGHSAAALHSNLAEADRRRLLQEFETGGLKTLVNVGILTEGWDSPKVDLIMMCRPTKAPALFVQMVGRGTRPAPAKTDLLILDLADNFKAHGDPGDPVIKIPGGGQGAAPVKACPTCQEIIAAATLTCPACGHAWRIELVDEPTLKMKEIKPTPPGQSRVVRWEGRGYVTYRGHYMYLLELHCRPGGQVRQFLDLEGAASPYGRIKAKTLWWRLSGQVRAPETVREAIERTGELAIPDFITLFKDSAGYQKIKEFK